MRKRERDRPSGEVGERERERKKENQRPPAMELAPATARDEALTKALDKASLAPRNLPLAARGWC